MRSAIDPDAKPIASIGKHKRYVAVDARMLDSDLVELRAVNNDHSPHNGHYAYKEIARRVVEAMDQAFERPVSASYSPAAGKREACTGEWNKRTPGFRTTPEFPR